MSDAPLKEVLLSFNFRNMLTVFIMVILMFMLVKFGGLAIAGAINKTPIGTGLTGTANATVGPVSGSDTATAEVA